jgi:hypothetical protein
MAKKKEPHGRAGGIAAGKARDKQALCGAKKRSDGKPCRQFAGFKTDHVGYGRCYLHGGATPTHRKGAVKAAAKERAPKFGQPRKVMPGDALLEMLWTSYGMVHWLADEIGKHKDLTSFEARVLVQAHAEERDRVAKIAATALAAGVQERLVRAAEVYGELIARLITSVLDDMKLTPAQQRNVPGVVRRHLLALVESEPPPLLGPPDLDGKATRKAAKAS